MNKRFLFIVKIIWVLLVISFVITKQLEYAKEDREREPYWEKLEEYQRSIKAEMIVDIMHDEHYTTTPSVSDWKIDELALALANAKPGGPGHPNGFGALTIEMDTTGTGIEPDVELFLAYEGERFVVCFDLSILRDGEPYAGKTFVGEGLNEWVRSVGIANKEDW